VARVEVTDDAVEVRHGPVERVLGVVRDFAVPVAQVEAAEVVHRVPAFPRGLRVGLHLPNVRVLGHFYRRGGRDYWNVHRGPYVLLRLAPGARYGTVAVQVEDPARVVRAVDRVRSRSRGGA
jgi:hypothetical protein